MTPGSEWQYVCVAAVVAWSGAHTAVRLSPKLAARLQQVHARSMQTGIAATVLRITLRALGVRPASDAACGSGCDSCGGCGSTPTKTHSREGRVIEIRHVD